MGLRGSHHITASSPLPIVACVYASALSSASSGVDQVVVWCWCRCLGVVKGVQHLLGVREDKQGLHTTPLIHAYFKVTSPPHTNMDGTLFGCSLDRGEVVAGLSCSVLKGRVMCCDGQMASVLGSEVFYVVFLPIVIWMVRTCLHYLCGGGHPYSGHEQHSECVWNGLSPYSPGVMWLALCDVMCCVVVRWTLRWVVVPWCSGLCSSISATRAR